MKEQARQSELISEPAIDATLPVSGVADDLVSHVSEKATNLVPATAEDLSFQQSKPTMGLYFLKSRMRRAKYPFWSTLERDITFELGVRFSTSEE